MSNNFIQMVKEFMVASDQRVGPNLADLYDNLIEEEFYELRECRFATPGDLKELCDLIWVCIGYGIASGYDLEGAFREVYRSNMTKVDPSTGKVIKREDGKVIKPPSYQPANMEPYV